MFLLFLFFPLICSLLIWILPFYLNKKKALLIVAHLYLSIVFLWFSYFVSICYFQTNFYCNLGAWVHCGSLFVDWSFQLDGLSIIMLGLVSIVSTVVHFFSLNYMAEDSNLVRFFSLLSLFTFFMFILVASDNFVVLFVGWEGIGICSFLLISFWQTRLSATKAALKAIVLNRIGDSAFIGGMSFLFLLVKSCDFSIVFSLIPFLVGQSFEFLIFQVAYTDVIAFLFLVGAVGKSAQLGLHGWLPEAMEGPTPVSALIHAATLVTAGVFLIIRCSPIFEYSPYILNIVLIIGGLTCIFGSTVACAQNDLKRIIAFSTTSQLGYMVFVCGLSAYNVALFHLLNHGFFKALLFLCAGAIIHASSHEQDIRKFGGFVAFLPFIYSAFLIGVLALIGFPFLSGFYSKEVAIELAFASYNINSFFIYWISTISAFLTTFYSIRCLYLTFLTDNNSVKNGIQNILSTSSSIFFALWVLIFGSIFSGLWFKDILIGFGSTFFGSSIYISSAHVLLDYEYISWFVKNLPLLGTSLGIFLALILNWCFFYYFNNSVFNKKVHLLVLKKNLNSVFLTLFINVRVFLNSKWFLDFVLNNYFGVFVLKHSYETCYKIVDKGILEIFTINGLSFSILRLSRCLIIRQTGYMYTTICLMLLCLVLVCTLCFLF